uniref:hypothetical protein n=1 Tax=uncultured Caulobacter sp. TaxID=158749 RepID=UPI0025D86CDB|nr:hypothetical protein [uncultured Caulobacter sp.]
MARSASAGSGSNVWSALAASFPTTEVHFVEARDLTIVEQGIGGKPEERQAMAAGAAVGSFPKAIVVAAAIFAPPIIGSLEDFATAAIFVFAVLFWLATKAVSSPKRGAALEVIKKVRSQPAISSGSAAFAAVASAASGQGATGVRSGSGGTP